MLCRMLVVTPPCSRPRSSSGGVQPAPRFSMPEPVPPAKCGNHAQDLHMHSQGEHSNRVTAPRDGTVILRSSAASHNCACRAHKGERPPARRQMPGPTKKMTISRSLRPSRMADAIVVARCTSTHGTTASRKCRTLQWRAHGCVHHIIVNRCATKRRPGRRCSCACTIQPPSRCCQRPPGRRSCWTPPCREPRRSRGGEGPPWPRSKAREGHRCGVPPWPPKTPQGSPQDAAITPLELQTDNAGLQTDEGASNGQPACDNPRLRHRACTQSPHAGVRCWN